MKKQPCPHMVDGVCTSPKSSSTVCVLDDTRAIMCRIITQEKANARVVGAPSWPVSHKRQVYERRTPARVVVKIGIEPASPFDALFKGK